MKDKKNILIIVDLEGIIGVTDLTDDNTNGLLLERELTLIIDLVSKYYNVFLCYDHNDGILPKINFSSRANIKYFRKIYSIDFSIPFERSFLIGFHAKKGEIGKFPHIFREEINKVKLGESLVGEIELIVNKLAYHNIPVSLISAESSAFKTINYDCVYHYVKDSLDCSEEYLYLRDAVLKAIKKSVYLIDYDESMITVIYDDVTISVAKKNGIVIRNNFNNTLEFCDYLKEMHIPLNKIMDIKLYSLCRIVRDKNIKSLENINDLFIKKLLLRSIMDLSYSEINAVYQYFSSL